MRRATPEAMAAAVRDLREAFPEGRLVLDAERLAEYGKDESDLGVFPPGVAVRVESAEEVRTIFAIASRHRVPGVPVAARNFWLMLSPVWQPQLRTRASRVKIPRWMRLSSFSWSHAFEALSIMLE